MELVRKMVLALEDAPGFANDVKVDGDYSAEQVAYHAYFLVDGGLAKGLVTTHINSSGPSRDHSASNLARP
jgi:hypothetical protein